MIGVTSAFAKHFFKNKNQLIQSKAYSTNLNQLQWASLA
jgi:hypothetical protein